MSEATPPRDYAEDDDFEECGCSDMVVPGEYYHCPDCDREWFPEDDEALEQNKTET